MGFENNEDFVIYNSIAKTMNESFYIISTNLALGDFYFNRNDNEKAFKYFKDALMLAQNETTKDNVEKIQLRIDDIRLRIGEERFNELEK